MAPAETPKGRPQGGMKSDAGRAAYWRMQWESCAGALADLIAEHREFVEAVEALVKEWQESDDGERMYYADEIRDRLNLDGSPTEEGEHR